MDCIIRGGQVGYRLAGGLVGRRWRTLCPRHLLRCGATVKDTRPHHPRRALRETGGTGSARVAGLAGGRGGGRHVLREPGGAGGARVDLQGTELILDD